MGFLCTVFWENYAFDLWFVWNEGEFTICLGQLQSVQITVLNVLRAVTWVWRNGPNWLRKTVTEITV